VEGAAKEVGVDPRTLQRWEKRPDGDDRRCGPRHKPHNALSQKEREQVLAVANRAEFRDKSPHQIVAILADRGEYVASESSFYRVLREAKQLAHRGRARRPTRRPVPVHKATAPGHLVSWDITYLPTLVRGRYLYLYLFVDVWSRKVIGWQVHDSEHDALSAQLLDGMAKENGGLAGLVVHSDNGGPMRGATMLAKMRELGVMPSFSRPRVSNDNPFSESLFKTMKYAPFWPNAPFVDIEAARAWVARFVDWYNDEHRHSALDYLTPSERHAGRGDEILAHRRRVYERARAKHPDRWSRGVRRWRADAEVFLNRPRVGRVRAKEADVNAA
jgi:putative transposase